jgi:RNA methyltransferase, TrmH family
VFLVEGPIAVGEAWGAGEVQDVFVDGEAPFASEWLDRGAVAASKQVMEALSETSTPQGIVGVARMRTISIAEASGDLVLVLADVRDPGNAGTLVRSAAAAGASAVVFCSGSVDPFNPKSVRSTAGLLFHLDLVTGVALPEVGRTLKSKGFSLVGADATSSTRPDEVDMTGPVALVLGNESWGIEEPARALLDEVTGIPMPGAAESLNVGIAGSILLFEAVRQRVTRAGEHQE